MSVAPTPPATENSDSTSSLGSRLKAAGQLAAKQAQRAAIANTTLPSGYKTLGRHIYSVKAFHEEFPDLYRQFDQLTAELRAVKEKSDHRPTAEGLRAKAVAAAASAKDMAVSKTLEMRVSQVFAALGERAFDKHGDGAGPAEMVAVVKQTRTQLTVLDQEIANLSKSKPGQLITPKRIVIAGIVFIGLVILGAMVGDPDKKGHGLTSVTASSSVVPSKIVLGEVTRVPAGFKVSCAFMESISYVKPEGKLTIELYNWNMSDHVLFNDPDTYGLGTKLATATSDISSSDYDTSGIADKITKVVETSARPTKTYVTAKFLFQPNGSNNTIVGGSTYAVVN
jgi:hypothetical protein